MNFNDNFDSNLIEILEKIVYDSNLVKELERAENTEDIYKICQKLGYNQDIAKFEEQILEIINYVQKFSDEDLERVSGGKNNLQKTCALLLTAINIGAPMTGATGNSKNHVLDPKTTNNIVLNKTDSNFKEKLGALTDKTNNYIRRGLKQIGEFAKNNPKTTAGISLASVASVPGFVYIANKLSSCIENSRNANEVREQQVRALFSELTEIFNNIKNNTEQYYEKLESNSNLQIIQSNGHIFAFIVHAKNAGFNISADVFNLKNNENLSFTDIINKLKNSTKDKNLLSVVDKLLLEKAEDIKNISIESKLIAQRAKLVKADEEQAEKEAEKEKKQVQLSEKQNKKDDKKTDEQKKQQEINKPPELVKTDEEQAKKEDEEVQKQAPLSEEQDKKDADEQKQCKTALESLRNTYSAGEFKNYNPGNYILENRKVAANKFLTYLVGGVLDNSKLQETKSEDYNNIADENLKNYMTHAMKNRDLSKIFDANEILNKLVFKESHMFISPTIENSPFLQDILKIGYLAQELYPKNLSGKFGRFSETNLSEKGKKYNEIYDQAIKEVEPLLKKDK